MLGNFGCNLGGRRFLTGMDRANRFDQLLAQQTLQQVGPRAGLQGAENLTSPYRWSAR